MTPRSISTFPVQQALNGADAVMADLAALYARLNRQEADVHASAAAEKARGGLVARWDRHLRVLSAALGRGSRHLDQLCLPYWLLVVNVNREIDRHLWRPGHTGGNTAQVEAVTARWREQLPTLQGVALGIPDTLPMPA